MSRLQQIFLSLAVAAAIFVSAAKNGSAEIYKYKDKAGNWVFTDTPRNDLQDTEVKAERQPEQSLDLAQALYQEFNPGNDIERASLSAVTVESPMGTGSGFFISEDCYLLTNRHVIRADAQIQQVSKAIDAGDTLAKDEENYLVIEEKLVKERWAILEDFKRKIDGIANPNARERYLFEYQQGRASLEAYEKKVAAWRDRYDAKKRKFDNAKSSFSDVARRAQNAGVFTVRLKNKKTVEARLVMVSSDLDLALLKIGRCRAPYLVPASPSEVRQGAPVYAIGSPVGITDTVSAGVVSGYDPAYIRTDAKIYPGNSGGPLITPQGKVIGINTLKEYTRNYEGLGLAIPIGRAMQEFRSYLQ